MNPFFFFFKQYNKTKEFYFTLKVDYSPSLLREGYRLDVQEYIYDPNGRSDYSVGELELRLKELIEKYLTKEIYEVFGFELKIKVKRTRRGSIVIFFSLILATYYGVSKYKNFVESVQLIAKHIEGFVQTFLDTQFPKGFNVVATANTVINHDKVERVSYTGLATIFGVFIGAFITGYFSIKTQEISNVQQLDMFSKQQTLAERQELKSILTEYCDLISDYTDLITDSILDPSKVSDYERNSFKIALKLSLLANSDLGSKTFQLNTIATQHLQRKLKGNYTNENVEYFANNAVVWTQAAKAELKYLEYSATPDIAERDFMRLMLNSIIAETKK